MKRFSEIKNKVHDASGIKNLDAYYWVEIDGIYYPSHKTI